MKLPKTKKGKMTLDNMFDKMILIIIFSGIIGEVVANIADAVLNLTGATKTVVSLVSLVFAAMFLRSLMKNK